MSTFSQDGGKFLNGGCWYRKEGSPRQEKGKRTRKNRDRRARSVQFVLTYQLWKAVESNICPSSFLSCSSINNSDFSFSLCFQERIKLRSRVCLLIHFSFVILYRLREIITKEPCVCLFLSGRRSYL